MVPGPNSQLMSMKKYHNSSLLKLSIVPLRMCGHMLRYTYMYKNAFTNREEEMQTCI